MATLDRSHRIYWSTPIGGRDRSGETCTILRERGGQCQVRFEDGTTAMLDRRAIRAAKCRPPDTSDHIMTKVIDFS